MKTPPWRCSKTCNYKTFIDLKK